MVKVRLLLFLFSVFCLLTAFSGNVSAQTVRDTNFTEPEIKIIKGRIKNGATASSLLNTYIPLKTIYQICDQSKEIFPLNRIRKGQPYRIMTRAGELIEFEYEINDERRLVITREEDDYTIAELPIYYDISLEQISATINYSLSGTIRKIGETNELACRLADIFAWDIDFIRDIKSGDSFTILVEKRFRDGRFRGYGDIQAAYFTNQGQVFKAFLYTAADGTDGYYDEQGNSMQKAFLKAPLAFSRISSKFTKKRLHPILNKVKAHNGVDYAAPSGTPVKTVGDGVITMAGYNKGSGNYIKIRHPNGFTTSYLHLSKFAKTSKINKRVVQGQVIGYVGQTGYATGPHLCFRLLKDGRHIDPLNYKAPSAKPVKADEMENFLAKIATLSQRLVAANKGTVPSKPSQT